MPFDFERYGDLMPRERVAELVQAAEPQVRPEWQSLYDGARELIDTAYLTAPDAGGPGSGLDQIEHVVVLINENRSFDHYFGTLSEVRGFDDPDGQGILKQVSPRAGGPGFQHPFRLDPAKTVHDPSHSWAAQHASWHDGAMDQWVTTHLATDGTAFGALTMGYYSGADLPIHHALADAFTLCDNYHCSVPPIPTGSWR